MHRAQDGDGNWSWVPVILGVHSWGKSDGHTGSVELTSDVVAMIKQLIGGTEHLEAIFNLHVNNNGDNGLTSGRGGWFINMDVNGVPSPQNGLLTVDDHGTYGLGGAEVSAVQTLNISFGGHDEDGYDIPGLSTHNIVPNYYPAYETWFRLGGGAGNSMSYDLEIQFHEFWAAR